VTVVNFKASPEMVAAIRARATAADRSMAAEIRTALRAYLARDTPDPANGTASEADDSEAAKPSPGRRERIRDGS